MLALQRRAHGRLLWVAGPKLGLPDPTGFARPNLCRRDKSGATKRLPLIRGKATPAVERRGSQTLRLWMATNRCHSKHFENGLARYEVSADPFATPPDTPAGNSSGSSTTVIIARCPGCLAVGCVWFVAVCSWPCCCPLSRQHEMRRKRCRPPIISNRLVWRSTTITPPTSNSRRRQRPMLWGIRCGVGG